MAELDAILGNDEGGMDMGMGDTNQGAPRRNPAYEQLLTAWRSEQACPEVLPWRGDFVDALLDAAEQQEAMVKATVEQGRRRRRVLVFGAVVRERARAVPFCGWFVRALSTT